MALTKREFENRLITIGIILIIIALIMNYIFKKVIAANIFWIIGALFFMGTFPTKTLEFWISTTILICSIIIFIILEFKIINPISLWIIFITEIIKVGLSVGFIIYEGYLLFSHT